MAHVFVLTEADTHDGINWSGSDSVLKKAILDVLMTMARSPCLEVCGVAVRSIVLRSIFDVSVVVWENGFGEVHLTNHSETLG